MSADHKQVEGEGGRSGIIGAATQGLEVRNPLWVKPGNYRYFTILTVSSWHRGHSKVRLSWSGVSAGSILTSHI
ncbi:MAG: hypothetical protein WBG13_31020 [Pseudolabrys sp.]